jgi:CubicO group peptidase (beta-lactamase class C family)
MGSPHSVLASMKKRYPMLVAALTVLAGGGLSLDWRLLSRAVTYPETPITTADWYEPLAPVPGNFTLPLPTATTSAVPRAALETVSAYAAARQSRALLVLHQGELIWEEYWQGYTATSTFNAMSMSKTVLALLIGIAIEEGHIGSVQDTVATYLPEWQQGDGPADYRPTLTLEDLLYMQSGLRNRDRTDSPFSDLVQMYLGSDIAATALGIPTVAPPGETYAYNNANSQILGLVLQRATGEPYAEYLSSRLWQAIGASDAAVWLDRPNGTAKTFCCLFATARDWARLGQLILDRGQVGDRAVVPPGWIAQMQVPSPIEPTYGYQIWVKARTADYPNVDQQANAAFLTADTVYLDGRGQQRVYVIPSLELVVVRVGENPEDWDDAVIPNTLIRSLQ